MIEIIKHGSKKYVCACPKCSCEFSYEDEDIKHYVLEYINVFREYVICPECNTEVTIYPN